MATLQTCCVRLTPVVLSSGFLFAIPGPFSVLRPSIVLLARLPSTGLIFPGACSDRYHHEGALSHLIGAKPYKLRESREPSSTLLRPSARNSIGPPRKPSRISDLRETRLSMSVSPRSRCLRFQPWRPICPERAPRVPLWSLSPTFGRRVAIPGRYPRGPTAMRL